MENKKTLSAEERLSAEKTKQINRTFKQAPAGDAAEAFYLDAVSINGLVLKNIPSEHRTLRVCAEAVKQNMLALEYVPNEHQQIALRVALIKRGIVFLEGLPDEQQKEVRPYL